MAGIVLGIAFASVMTILDWRLNPGGIFHNANGTEWVVVMETALSWFLPVAAAGSVVGAVILFLITCFK